MRAQQNTHHVLIALFLQPKVGMNKIRHLRQQGGSFYFPRRITVACNVMSVIAVETTAKALLRAALGWISLPGRLSIIQSQQFNSIRALLIPRHPSQCTQLVTDPPVKPPLRINTAGKNLRK